MAVTIDLQDDVADPVLPPRKYLRDAASDHHPHQLTAIDLRQPAGTDRFAVPEHSEIVGHAEDLVEFVADEQDSFARLSERFDYTEQVFRFLVAERRGRFVHDDDSRVDR